MQLEIAKGAAETYAAADKATLIKRTHRFMVRF